MPDQAKPVAGTTKKGKPRIRAPRNCRKCGRPGARADGCGTSHQPLKKSDDNDDDERAPRTKTIAALIENSSIGRGLKNMRENGVEAELADLDRELHPRAHRLSKPKPLDTTTVAIRSSSPCPHGNGSAASCSQCVLGGAKVKTVAIVGGTVTVDGAAVRSTKEHELAARPHQATRGAKIQRARKARQDAAA